MLETQFTIPDQANATVNASSLNPLHINITCTTASTAATTTSTNATLITVLLRCCHFYCFYYYFQSTASNDNKEQGTEAFEPRFNPGSIWGWIRGALTFAALLAESGPDAVRLHIDLVYRTVPGGTEYPNGHSHVAALRYRDRLCAASQIANILLESV